MTRATQGSDGKLPTWPLAKVADALHAVALAGGLHPGSRALPAASAGVSRADPAALRNWVDVTSGWLDIDCEEVSINFNELDAWLDDGGPSVLRIGEQRLLAVVKSTRPNVLAVAPDGTRHAIARSRLRDLLVHDAHPGLLQDIAEELRNAGLPQDRKRVSELLLRARLEGRTIASGWLTSLPLHRSTAEHLRQHKLVRRMLSVLGIHLLFALVWIASWWMLGRGALSGRLDTGWITGWAACLLSLVILRAATQWMQGSIAIDFAAFLKRRLLAGSLVRDRDQAQAEGVGRVLGTVLESDALESLSVGGGFAILLSAIELILAPFILYAGAGGAWHAALLVAWILPSAVIATRFVRAKLRWTDTRVDMTRGIVENMVGHRSRLVQEEPDKHHEHEEHQLNTYAEHSRDADAAQVGLLLTLARGWLVVAVAGLLPAFVYGQWTPATAAISVGGILFAYQSLASLAGGIDAAAAALVAWRAVRSLYTSAATRVRAGSPQTAELVTDLKSGDSLLEARQLSFSYPGRERVILEDVALQIRAGERILLEGGSGSGKSTLASVLAGQRQSHQGGLFLHGLDQASIGIAAWRKRVALTPQFHENHIIGETFAFNLLMGRAWPPRRDDMILAHEICEELGLNVLLDTMPGGMLQIVGQNGWQLSHGEQSRVFIARALLQDADLVILDESLAALDPQLLCKTATCVRKRAKTLLLIAHP